jgi:hypothetical protein
LIELRVPEDVPESVLPLREVLVIACLVSPGSEMHTWNWAEYHSLPELVFIDGKKEFEAEGSCSGS